MAALNAEVSKSQCGDLHIAPVSAVPRQFTGGPLRRDQLTSAGVESAGRGLGFEAGQPPPGGLRRRSHRAGAAVTPPGGTGRPWGAVSRGSRHRPGLWNPRVLEGVLERTPLDSSRAPLKPLQEAHVSFLKPVSRGRATWHQTIRSPLTSTKAAGRSTATSARIAAHRATSPVSAYRWSSTRT
jgi:hypothetical protein